MKIYNYLKKEAEDNISQEFRLMYFNFCFCFFPWCSYGNYGFYNRVKSLCNNCRNLKKIGQLRKKNRKHDKIVSNSIEVSISKALIDSNIVYDEFVLINNLLKEYDVMKEVIKNLKIKQFIEDFRILFSYFLKCAKNTESKKPRAVKIKN